jgi:PAS domain S-box-containing protein
VRGVKAVAANADISDSTERTLRGQLRPANGRRWSWWPLPGLFLIFIGVAALVGWLLDFTALKSVVASCPSMKPNVAIGCVLTGVAQLISRSVPMDPTRRMVARICAACVIAIGVLTLSEYLFGWDLGIDQLLFHEASNAVGTSAPGRMGANAAVVCVLAGLALFLVDVDRRGVRPTQLLAVAIGVIALVACAGYVLEAQSLTAFGSASRISVQAAIAFVLLSAALLLVRPHVGLMELATSAGPGGHTIRRLVVPSIVVPIFIGWVIRQGERAGLYQPVQILGLVVVTVSLFFMTLAWLTARALDQADAERHRAEKQFRGLLEAAPDAIVAVDGDGLIRLVNRQAEVRLGYEREELIGQPVELLVPERVRAVHPSHRAGYFQNPTARPMGAGWELAARRKDGTEFPVDVSLSSLETEDGVLVSAAMRDITDRKRIEEEQAKLKAQLQQAQRDDERAVLETELHQAQRLESVGQLAGGVAHDFNNLLGAIMCYAGLASDSISEQMTRRGLDNDEDFVTLAEDVEEITKVAKRGADLTHQLLIFSRREVMTPEVLDLNSIVLDMEKLLRRTIGENIEPRTVLAPNLLRTKADRGQVEQVLMNLVVNARDAMPKGGKLAIETADFDADKPYARTHSIAVGRYVRLSVSDTGEGMTPEVSARAFEPFFTTKPKGSGTGLGLATVYGIAKQAGGDVVIDSEPGLGTTIKVNLPATAESASAPRHARQATSLESTGETVLLVEDEEIVREPTRRMLVRHGYTVLTAANAEEALRIARQHVGQIHLLLTDVVMPGRSGKELSAEIARLSSETKVLFMSGYSHDVIVHQGQLEEGVNLIEKPFSAERLLERLRDILDGR